MEEEGVEPSPAPPPAPRRRANEAPGGALVQGGVIKGVIIGIGVLLLAAAVLLQIRGYLDPATFPSSEDYNNVVRTAIIVGALLVNVAMILLLVYSLLVGVLRTDLTDSTRKAFMAFALILFIFWWIPIVLQGQLLSFVPPFP